MFPRSHAAPGRAHDLHVLLRHRLLLQAEVGERVLAVPVDNEPHYFAASYLKQLAFLRPQLPERRAARLAGPTQSGEDKNAGIVQLSVLLGLDT